MKRRRVRCNPLWRMLCVSFTFVALTCMDVGRVQSQPIVDEDVIGTWTGELQTASLLTLEIQVQETSPGHYRAHVAGADRAERDIRVWRDGESLRFQSSMFAIAFRGFLTDKRDALAAFLHHGSHVSQISLKPRNVQRTASPSSWFGSWSSLGVAGERFPIELYVVRDGDGLAGYLFFRHQHLPSLWTHDFRVEGETISFREKNLALQFEGRLDRSDHTMRLEVSAVGGRAPVTFRRLTRQVLNHASRFQAGGDLATEVVPRPESECDYVARAPEPIHDGWPTAPPSSEGFAVEPLRAMLEAICSQEMTLTHSVLIARRGTLVVEEYFYGHDRNTWHDMRSASKTVTSALIGVAIDQGRIESVHEPALSFFPTSRQFANWDPRKTDITVRHLLTMSSGLDADDTRRESVANENNYQSQTQRRDWIRLALDAPMIRTPGTQALYGSANPMILGGILDRVVAEPVEAFAHRCLFGPLGVENYKFYLDPTGVVYMGGGLYMRPRDMAKFGQLYLNGGTWDGTRILSAEWVRESLGKYGRLANARDENEYGYLWWHKTYVVGDERVDSVEARGNGGQYIFVVPSLELVVVITGGNYRNGRFRQPEEIMQRFILPALF